MNIEPRAFYMYKTAAKNPEVFALLSEQPVVIFHSATKQDHRFFFLFSWTGGFASRLYYCFTVSNYWAVECQTVNKLPHCYSGAPTGAGAPESTVYGTVEGQACCLWILTYSWDWNTNEPQKHNLSHLTNPPEAGALLAYFFHCNLKPNPNFFVSFWCFKSCSFHHRKTTKNTPRRELKIWRQ